MTHPIILASGSQIRQDLLSNAGVDFDVLIPRVDELMIRESLLHEGAKPRDIADQLAEAKTRKIADKSPGRLVLGCDQILHFDGMILGKPESPEQALSHLEMLSGQTHQLLSAAVIYDDGRPIWRSIGEVKLHMRTPTKPYLSDYVTRNWDSIRHSVGAYKLEEEGVRLFNKIDGDYFNVLGIPLLDVLAFLTLRGVIDG